MAASGNTTQRIARLTHHVLSTSLCAGPRDELVPAPRDIVLNNAEMDALQARYDEERDKRLHARPEGNEQYVNIKDLALHDERFARMLSDPYPPPSVAVRAATTHPVKDMVTVCVVGAGYGGLCAGARLVEAGVDPSSIRILDSANDVGGTWYWNRYPGAMCDIESYVYMPLCEELGYVPKEKYAHQTEMLEHCHMIMDHYGLWERACLGAQVTGMFWDETRRSWCIKTHCGDDFQAQFVIMNFGLFTQPKLPNVRGVDTYRGEMFHTSRWNYPFTGGSSSGNLTGLANKRVGLIGTGATAIQVVPHLGRDAQRLFVFQRTPSSVDLRDNRFTTPEYAAEHLSKPGWQKDRQVNFIQMAQTPRGAPVDLVHDGWTEIIRNLAMSAGQHIRSKMSEAKKKGVEVDMAALMQEAQELSRLAEFQQMEKVRRRAEIVVKDPQTADSLKPWYNQFCKRPCFHDDYLNTFNLPTVTLVDTKGLGIEAFTERGIVANGVEYDLDVVVLATGFEQPILDTAGKRTAPHRLGYDILGRDGQALSEKWHPAGPQSFEAYTTQGFPNLFCQNAPFDVFTVNFTHRLDESATHFAYMISTLLKDGYSVIDTKAESEKRFLDRQRHKSPPSLGIGCTPSYYNNEGVTTVQDKKRLAGVPHKASALGWFKELRKRREEGSAFEGFDLH